MSSDSESTHRALTRSAIVSLSVVAATVLVAGFALSRSPTNASHAVTVPRSDSAVPGQHAGASRRTRTAADGATFGTMPHIEGQVSPTEMFDSAPDYISVVSGSSDAIVGYIKKTDMFAADGDTYVMTGAGAVLPVYANDGTTVVGHFSPGTGFVPLGQETSSLPGAVR
jgi:hypothetical protein